MSKQMHSGDDSDENSMIHSDSLSASSIPWLNEIAFLNEFRMSPNGFLEICGFD
jgi:hypothetical protein